MSARHTPVLWVLAATLALCAAIGIACERESRQFRQLPEVGARPTGVRLSPLQPGKPSPPDLTKSPYQDNAWAVSEGKRYYQAYNCVGCHSNGGGGMGPPLMDSEWIYGNDPRQIFSTIVEGRPNGMPAFGGRVPEQQVWMLVAYVQSLAGQLPKDVAPGRSDHMAVAPQEQSRERAKGVQSRPPQPR
jgi:cytochrome c oxidase cbb3-type subunit 3